MHLWEQQKSTGDTIQEEDNRSAHPALSSLAVLKENKKYSCVGVREAESEDLRWLHVQNSIFHIDLQSQAGSTAPPRLFHY